MRLISIIAVICSVHYAITSDIEDENGGIYTDYNENDWIDPHDPLGENKWRNRHREGLIEPGNQEADIASIRASLKATQEELITCKLKKSESTVTSSITYFKHFMQTFTEFMKPIEQNNGYYGIQLMMSKDAYDQLRILLNQDKSNAKDILDLINTAFEPFSISTWQQLSYDYLSPIVLCSVAVVLATIMLLLYCNKRLNHGVSWRRHIMMTVLLCYACSIPWEWFRMYKVALSKKTTQTIMEMPETCYPNKMTVWTSLKLWFADRFTLGDNQCVKYHEAILVDPIWEVSPFQAAAVCTSRFIVEPMKQFAEACGISFRLFFKEIPMQWQPFVFIAVLVIILFIVMAMSGFEVSTPLFKIGVRPNQVPIARYEQQFRELEHRNQELELVHNNVLALRENGGEHANNEAELRLLREQNKEFENINQRHRIQIEDIEKRNWELQQEIKRQSIKKHENTSRRHNVTLERDCGNTRHSERNCSGEITESLGSLQIDTNETTASPNVTSSDVAQEDSDNNKKVSIATEHDEHLNVTHTLQPENCEHYDHIIDECLDDVGMLNLHARSDSDSQDYIFVNQSN